MKSKKKIYPVFYYFISILFGIMMVGILYINLFISKKREFPCKKQFLLSNIKLLLIGVIVLSLLIFFYNKFIKKYVEKLTRKQCNILLFLYFVITFVMQIYLIKKIFFLTGWDVGQLRGASYLLLQGVKLNNGNGYDTYFMVYPNNLFLLFIYVVLMKTATIIKINPNLLLSIVSALSVNVSCILVVKIIAKISKNKSMCVLSAFLCFIFLLFSPWIIIPYSDTYAVFFTTSVLYVYLNKNYMNRYLATFLIIFLTFVGYKIKPTVVIILIAIIFIELWKLIFSKEKDSLKIIFKKTLVAGVAILLISILNVASTSYLGFKRNTIVETPMTHFIMMGMNEEKRGVYCNEDLLYTQKYAGLDKKKEANIKEIKRRLKKYGLSGYCQLLLDKSLINYNDGTFAWGVEGNFYPEVCAENGRVATLLRNIYYNDGSGKYYSYFETSLQCVWILLLVLSFFSVGSFKNYGITTVIQLTIIGITLFLLLFEARARYLLLYGPYFILLATIGYAFIKNRIDFVITSRNMR